MVVVAGSLRPYHAVIVGLSFGEIPLESIWDQPFCERSEPKGLRKVRPPQKGHFQKEDREILCHWLRNETSIIEDDCMAKRLEINVS